MNSSKTVSKAINSVQLQTGVSFEHLIQDSCSIDGTLDILQAFGTEYFSLEVKKDDGIYSGLNNAILRAKGDIIGFCHSDDCFNYDRVLGDYLSHFESTGADLVYADLRYISTSNKMTRMWRPGKFEVQLLKNGWMPPHPTVFAKRKVFEEVGLFDTKYQTSADYHWLIKALKNSNVKTSYLQKTTVLMSTGGKSTSGVFGMIAQAKEDYDIVKRENIGGFWTICAKRISKLKQFVKV
jgi:glycosyltransferase involved in cell wall biosynthesis